MFESRPHEVFTVVSYQGPHGSTCVSDTLQLDHRNMDSKFISYHIRNLVEIDLSIKVRVLIEVIKQQFHFTISYKKAWLAKQKAIAHVFGDWDESFQILPHFICNWQITWRFINICILNHATNLFLLSMVEKDSRKEVAPFVTYYL